jgi:CTP synthase
MSPYQHGEVFVTDDGAETDLDLGHYERFTGVNASKADNATTGRIYSDVIARGRAAVIILGEPFRSSRTSPMPSRSVSSAEPRDWTSCLSKSAETVGDIESLPFLEAIRQLRNDLGAEKNHFRSSDTTALDSVRRGTENQTDPALQLKELQNVGIQPQILLCRCDRPIPENERRKIANFCNVRPQAVIAARDVDTIYACPLSYHAEGMDSEVLHHFGLPYDKEPDLSSWHRIVNTVREPGR